MNRPIIFADFPGSGEIERAVSEAFEVTRAASTIRNFNVANHGRAPQPWEDVKLQEYAAKGLSDEEQAELLTRSVSWVRYRRRNLGLVRDKS